MLLLDLQYLEMRPPTILVLTAHLALGHQLLQVTALHIPFVAHRLMVQRAWPLPGLAVLTLSVLHVQPVVSVLQLVLVQHALILSITQSLSLVHL
jgi:hypothetical protein